MAMGRVSADSHRPVSYTHLDVYKRQGMEGSLKSNKVQLIRERAVLAGDGQVEAGGRRYFAEKILLACGAAPTRLPIPGLELAVTSDELLSDVALPASLVIIGGGVIGVELAFAWSAFGCQVTIIEALDRILANLDQMCIRDRAAAMLRERKRVKAIVAASAHPEVLATIRTYCFGNGMEVVIAPERDGRTDLAACLLYTSPGAGDF